MAKGDRKKVTEQKNKLRGEITELLGKIRGVGTVPARVLAGDSIAAAAFKDALEGIRQKESCSYQHGTLSDLEERAATLKGWLAAIS